jgi:hypothetical protein
MIRRLIARMTRIVVSTPNSTSVKKCPPAAIRRMLIVAV